jgi:hypothetical protein
MKAERIDGPAKAVVTASEFQRDIRGHRRIAISGLCSMNPTSNSQRKTSSPTVSGWDSLIVLERDRAGIGVRFQGEDLGAAGFSWS